MTTKITTKAGERTQHTPGPWAAHSDGNINAYGIPSINVAQCRGGLSLAQNAANARLIAAAPDLKRALGYAFDFIVKVQNGSFDPRDIDGLQHTMLAALDKTSPDAEVAF